MSVRSFETRSPVVVLLNEAPGSNAHVAAILDRFHDRIDFDPDKAETLAYARSKEIVGVQTLELFASLPIIPSLRTMVTFEANCRHYGNDAAIRRLLESYAHKTTTSVAVVKRIHPHAIVAMEIMETMPKKKWIVEFGKQIGKPIVMKNNGKKRDAENYAAVQRAFNRVQKDAKSMLEAKQLAMQETAV